MARRICLENIVGQCSNPNKFSGVAVDEGWECPYCLRENGKDGNDTFITEPEKAEKVFQVLKDKVKE